MILPLIAHHPIIALVCFALLLLFFRALCIEGENSNKPDTRKPAPKGNNLDCRLVENNVVANRRYNF